MEQTRNKEGGGIFRGHREEGAAGKLAAKRKDRLTENIDGKLDAKLKKAFKSTFKTANVGFLAWGVLLFGAALCLPIWKMTGARWISYAGAGSFLLAIGGIFTAFVAQTSNMSVRLDARLKGKGKDFFKEEEMDCSLSKTAAECYGFVKRFLGRGKGRAKSSHSRYETRRARAGMNARARCRAPRPAFAHSSHGGGGGDGDSGDSDQGGDPPGPSRHTASLKLSQPFFRKSNSPSNRRRPPRVPGCWPMPRRKPSGGRWAE